MLSAAFDRASSLTPREQARLASILARLASPYEGERAAAALLASAFMERHGLAWSDLAIIQKPGSQPGAAARPGGDRRRNANRPWRGYCRRHPPQSGHALSCLA